MPPTSRLALTKSETIFQPGVWWVQFRGRSHLTAPATTKLQTMETAAVPGRAVPRLRRLTHATFPLVRGSTWIRGCGQDLRIMDEPSRPRHTVPSLEAERKRGTNIVYVNHISKHESASFKKPKKTLLNRHFARWLDGKEISHSQKYAIKCFQISNCERFKKVWCQKSALKSWSWWQLTKKEVISCELIISWNSMHTMVEYFLFWWRFQILYRYEIDYGCDPWDFSYPKNYFHHWVRVDFDRNIWSENKNMKYSSDSSLIMRRQIIHFLTI